MSEPPAVGGRRSRGGGSAPRRSTTGDDAGAASGLSVSSLIRGYPPVLGAMLLVDGVLTVILGGDATVSLGEVVAYLLLPPLAMFLLTQLTGGRRPDAVTIGAGVAGAAVILAALFLGGGVHLLTLPGWVLALVGLVLLGVAVFLMRRNAPGRAAPPVSPLLSPDERDDDGYGRSGTPGWPSSRPDDDPVAYPAERAFDDTGAGLPPAHSAGPSEPEWPPRRDPADARPSWTDSGDARPDWPTAGEARPSYPADARPSYLDEARPSYPDEPRPSYLDEAQPQYSGEAQPSYPGEARPGWSEGPAEREWPPGPAADGWPARRDPEPAPDAQRSWFDTEEAPSDPSDREWPPTSGGRRSRNPDHDGR